jgi:hypothetical protein
MKKIRLPFPFQKIERGIIACVIMSMALQSEALIQTPVVPNASPEARALLHFLQSQRGQHILSGQNEDTDNILWHRNGQGGKEIPFIHRITGINMEAEEATALGGVSLTTYPNANFTGWGYVDLSGKKGAGYAIRWSTSVGSATTTPLSIRFANGSSSTRYLHLLINGSTNSTLTFPTTGSWNLYSTVTTPSITFPAGSVEIALVPSAGTAGPNIDKLEANLPSMVSFQAETASMEGGVVASSSNGGYTGSGYADYPGETGSGVRIVWTVNSETAGTRELSFRYANGGASARPLHLVVNGGTPILLNFGPTGGWSVWALETATAIPFNAGDNIIELRATAGSQGANLDRMDMSVPATFDGQAEDATLQNVSAVFVNDAFTGTGFAPFPNTQGSGVLLRWNIDLPENKTMPLAIRYANGSNTDRLLQLKINGTNAALLTFPPSGDWNTYFTLFTPVLNLTAGPNVVELVASAGTYGPYIDALQHSGKIPAIRAFDFIWDCQATYDQYNGGEVVQQRNVQRAIDWWNDGGIVTLQWHWFLPNSEETGGTFGTQIALDLNLATTPGTAEYNYLIADMDIAANNLKQLRDAGVPVLWRPYHEAGGRWFWWGKEGPEIYKKLWKIMFNRFTYHHNLNNLLWVNNTDFNLDEWYPGDDTVDVIASDQYAAPGVHDIFETAFDKFDDFNDPGKVIAMSENGPIPDPAQLQAQSVDWAYFCTWSSSFILDGKLNPVTNIVSIYNHPYVMNRGDLPNLKSLAAPAVGPAMQLAFSRPVRETALGFSPPRPVTVEPVDANGRVVRTLSGAVDLRWEAEYLPLVSTNLIRGVATFNLPVLQRPQNGQRLIASLAGLDGYSPAAVVGPGSGYKWERWDYSGSLSSAWSSQRDAILASTPTSSGEAAVSSSIPSTLTTGDNFVVRLSGSVIAPTNGNYSFWVHGDDRVELWLQTSLASSTLTKVAYTSQSQSKDQWDEEAIQHSGNYTLQAGKAYNFEFIMAEFGGNAFGAFGWTLPDGSLQRPIPATYLQFPGGYRYENWIASEGLTGADADFNADPDGDGRSNLAEFAFGLSPTRQDAEPQRLFITHNTPNFTLPIPSGDDVTVTVYSTTDLTTNNWTAVATWMANDGWTLSGGVTDISLSPATNELLDERGFDQTFYMIEATLTP